MIEGGWSLLLTTTGGSNQAPTISSISNQSINANTSTGAIPFTIGDPDTSLASLVLTGTSSNQHWFPTATSFSEGAGRTGP